MSDMPPDAPSNINRPVRPPVDPAFLSDVFTVLLHDYRDALVSIRDGSEVLRAHPQIPAELQPELAQIVTASNQAQQLLETMTALFGPAPEQFQSVDINSVVQRCESLLGKLAGARRTVTLSLGGRIAALRSPEGMLDNVLLRLFVHALGVVEPGRAITIRTYQDSVHDADAAAMLIKPQANTAHFAVLELSGAANLDEPSWQQSWLDLARNIHGLQGVLAKKINPGEGLVRIYFPVAHAAVASPGPDAFSPRGNETILVAEDDPGSRRVISRILQSHGYKVLEAENGASAVRTMLHHDGQVDLLLADVMMPDFDGPSLAEQISKLRSHVKVIYVSGFDRADLNRQDVFLQGEEVSLVKKPFRREELLSLVRSTLDRS